MEGEIRVTKINRSRFNHDAGQSFHERFHFHFHLHRDVGSCIRVDRENGGECCFHVYGDIATPKNKLDEQVVAIYSIFLDYSPRCR